MEKKLKIGIIGCGGIANGKHMPALKRIKEVEMVAFCDIIPERAEKAANKFGTPDAKVYTDYKELLKDKSIDVVHGNTALSPLTPWRAASTSCAKSPWPSTARRPRRCWTPPAAPAKS